MDEALKIRIEAEAKLFERRSAAGIEALKLVQHENGWVDDDSIREIATLLDMTPDEVDSVATFYNLVCRKPTGRHVIRICSSVTCWVMGYEALVARLGIAPGQTTADGRFTLLPNQCLGACDHAPVLMIDDDLYCDVEPGRLDDILAKYE
ncbi:MAG: NADH-quinone oxidoreductase subunit NuoE [Candidatus Hydrogenedentes bacterium]|nr:NADH-quinone oxidoreductase subunit NuoE [Candidatus Hydrogenedentota bacterium]